MAALSVGLGLDRSHLRDLFGDQPMSLAKFIHYPPTPAFGAGVNPHHDAGFLTVLAPGPTPGLQVQNPDGAWIDVPIVPDTFVINLGEILQSMTGNYLVATPPPGHHQRRALLGRLLSWPVIDDSAHTATAGRPLRRRDRS